MVTDVSRDLVSNARVPLLTFVGYEPPFFLTPKRYRRMHLFVSRRSRINRHNPMPEGDKRRFSRIEAITIAMGGDSRGDGLVS